MASQDLTSEALAGFAAQLGGRPAHQARPHYTSSPAGMAWLVGAWLQKTGRAAPRDVRMSRGYTVRVGDMRVSVADAAALVRVL
jgi:metal-dependent amidase/aminoacylase/carboxypeptidase family protein